MLSPNRTYPIDAGCSKLATSQEMVTDLYGVAICLTSTVLPESYETFPNVDDRQNPHPVYDHPIFKKYQSLIAEIEASENAAYLKAYETRLHNAVSDEERERIETNGPQFASLSVKCPYDTPAFEFVPKTDGIHLAVKHWAPAPAYPAACNPIDVLRRRKSYGASALVIKDHGYCLGLKTITLNPKHPKFDDVVSKYGETPAITTLGKHTRLTYWEILPAYPVARSADQIDLSNLDLANGSERAQQRAQAPCTKATDFIGRAYVKEATAIKKLSHLLKKSWIELAKTEDDKWGAQATYWKVCEDSGRLTALEQQSLEERRAKTLTPTVEQDIRPFGLFGRFDEALHPKPDLYHEGSGRTMGL